MSGRYYHIDPLPGYAEPYGTLLATMQDGTREWREELGSPDPKLIVWQPVSKGHSIGGIMLHIAECEAYWIEEIALGNTIDPEEARLHMTAEIDQYNGSSPTPPEEPIEYYYAILDRVRERTLERFKSMAPASTIKPQREDTMTLGWILGHILQHESYHGGQAVLLSELGKRLNSY